MFKFPRNLSSRAMPSLLDSATLLAALCCAGACYALYHHVRASKSPLPPGPRGLPLVGNLFDAPATFQWKVFKEWSKKYNSDIIHLDLAGTPLIILCSYEATDTLLEKRSSMYSDRPSLPMIMDLMGCDYNIAFMKYGEEWRTHRRLFNQAFHAKAAEKYQQQQFEVTLALLKRLMHTPDGFSEHFRLMTGELIMSVAYGIDVLPSDDPYITVAEEAIHTLSVANIPRKYLVDEFPILKHVPNWFPGAGFKRQAAEWRKLARAMMETPFAETKRQMESGIARASFTSDSLNDLKESASVYYAKPHVKATAGSMFIGGADTTVSALRTFILAMLANPDAQRQAQAEIDFVTGRKYLPSFHDRDALLYVSALVKEVLRWENVALFALPHFLTTEDEYHGYRLPAGSIVIGNTWSAIYSRALYLILSSFVCSDPGAFFTTRTHIPIHTRSTRNDSCLMGSPTQP
ncbi:cytochrome P450 [Mycena sp. CBHHK59/15]|nr:cytochrome P450 [Mycena sp. CBHHK59/15]